MSTCFIYMYSRVVMCFCIRIAKYFATGFTESYARECVADDLAQNFNDMVSTYIMFSRRGHPGLINAS